MILLVINTAACSVKKDSLADQFRITKEIQHERVEVRNNESYSQIYRLLIEGENLIAYDYTGDFFFSKTDLRNQTIDFHFGRKGQGPNEVMMMPNGVTIFNNKLYFYSINQSALFFIDYRQESDCFPEKVMASNREDQIMEITPIDFDKFVALGGFKEGRYLLLDKDGGKISYNFDYPTFDGDKDTSPMHKFMAFQGHLVSRPDGKSFFFAGSSSELFEIIEIRENDVMNKVFDFQGELAQFVLEGDGIKISSAAIKKESKMFFIDANCTQNYIYLLISDKIIGDDFYNAIRSNKILVFDWNGNPVTSLSLDIEVNSIAVDSSDKVLYAYDQGNEQLVKFNL